MALSCSDRGQHWFTKFLRGKPTGNLKYNDIVTMFLSLHCSRIVHMFRSMTIRNISATRLLEIQLFSVTEERMKQSIQRNKQKTEGASRRQTDSRIDAGSTVLLLLDDLVSVTDFVKRELLIGGSHVVMWVWRNVLKTVESIICPITHSATVEIHLFTPAKLVKLLTPLKCKRRKDMKRYYKLLDLAKNICL